MDKQASPGQIGRRRRRPAGGCAGRSIDHLQPPGGFVAGHGLRYLQLAAVLKIGGDAGGPEAVATDLGLDAGALGPSLDHHVHVGLGKRGPADQFAVPHCGEACTKQVRKYLLERQWYPRHPEPYDSPDRY